MTHAHVDGSPSFTGPKVMSWTVEDGIDLMCPTATITLSGLYDQNQVASYQDTYLQCRDHTGTLQTVFVGFLPQYGWSRDAAKQRTTVKAEAYSKYLSSQSIPDEYLSTAQWDDSGEVLSFREPGSVVTALCGGSMWDSTTGVNPMYVLSASEWNSTYTPKGWGWDKTSTTKINACMEMADYMDYIFDTMFSGTEERAVFCPLADIDTYLGAAVQNFTGTDDPQYVVSINADNKGNEKYNKVTVKAPRNYRILSFGTGTVELVAGYTLLDGTTGATATIDTVTVDTGTWGAGTAAGTIIISYDRTGPFKTGSTIIDSRGAGYGAAVATSDSEPTEQYDVYTYSCESAAVTAGSERAREWREDLDQEWDSTHLIEEYANDLLTLYAMDATSYTIVFNHRADLRLWQKINLSGYTKITDADYRIIHIIYSYQQGENLKITCTVQNNEFLTTQRRMKRQQRYSDVDQVKNMIEKHFAENIDLEDSTIEKVQDEYLVVRRADGQYVRAFAPQA